MEMLQGNPFLLMNNSLKFDTYSPNLKLNARLVEKTKGRRKHSPLLTVQENLLSFHPAFDCDLTIFF